MAYNEHLAERINIFFTKKNANFYEKKMFGGLCFMVNDKMCAGVVKEEVMARIGPDAYEDALNKPGCSLMNFTGRPMKGYVFLDSAFLDNQNELEYWLQLCLDFNPMAKASPKKNKKDTKKPS